MSWDGSQIIRRRPLGPNTCSNKTCCGTAVPGRKLCLRCGANSRKSAAKQERERKAGLAAFLTDPTLLPKKPPGIK